MTTAGLAEPHRRVLLAAWLAGVAALSPRLGWSEGRPEAFDRAAYDRYIQLMNAGDTRFVEYYADDIKFVMGISGKASVLNFYARQRSFVKESLEVLFFCSDATGAAAQVRSELRCIRDCGDTKIFGRALKAGEAQLIEGCLLYVLNAQGKIAEIKGPPPVIVRPWTIEAA